MGRNATDKFTIMYGNIVLLGDALIQFCDYTTVENLKHFEQHLYNQLNLFGHLVSWIQNHDTEYGTNSEFSKDGCDYPLPTHPIYNTDQYNPILTAVDHKYPNIVHRFITNQVRV